MSSVFAIALLAGLYVASLFFPVGSARLLAGLIPAPSMDRVELQVQPGDTTVAKGSDVTIQAVAMGFDPQRAQVHLRYSNGTQWESSTMEITPQNVPTFRHLVFNVQERVHYFVEADGYRSREFTVDVQDLPRVEKMDYSYNYPADLLDGTLERSLARRQRGIDRALGPSRLAFSSVCPPGGSY
jgi:hypothetical protein